MEIEPGIYRHFKGGEYEVIGVGHHSESLESLVIYKSLHETQDFPKGTIWVRPLELFTGTATVDGKEIPRFTRHES